MNAVFQDSTSVTEAFVQRGNEVPRETCNEPIRETKSKIYLVNGTGSEAREGTVAHQAYLTTFDQNDEVLKVETLGRALEGTTKGNVELKQTPHGILAAFDKRVDCTRMIDMALSKIFGVPVVLWNSSPVSI